MTLDGGRRPARRRAALVAGWSRRPASAGSRRSGNWTDLRAELAFWPACRSGVERRRGAQYNKAPFMYEMKGALSGRALPARPVARLPRRRAPPAGAKHPLEPPVSRLFPCPGVAPGWCPFPTVKVFLLPSLWSRKSLREFIFSFFRVHTLSTECRPLSACHNGYPPAYTQHIHRLPAVTPRIPVLAFPEAVAIS